MSKPAHHIFQTHEQLHTRLQANHACETELWVRIFKKATAYAGSATMAMAQTF